MPVQGSVTDGGAIGGAEPGAARGSLSAGLRVTPQTRVQHCRRNPSECTSFCRNTRSVGRFGDMLGDVGRFEHGSKPGLMQLLRPITSS